MIKFNLLSMMIQVCVRSFVLCDGMPSVVSGKISIAKLSLRERRRLDGCIRLMSLRELLARIILSNSNLALGTRERITISNLFA